MVNDSSIVCKYIENKKGRGRMEIWDKEGN